MNWQDFEIDGEVFTAEQQRRAFVNFRGSKRDMAGWLSKGRDVSDETLEKAATRIIEQAKDAGRVEWSGSAWVRA